MSDSGFLIVAVMIGGTVLGTVLWRYLKLSTQGEVALSTTLALIGFLLVSTPLWASIVVEGPQWQISLLKDRTEAQAEQFLTLVETYQKTLPEADAEKVSSAVSELRRTIEKINESTNKSDELEQTRELLQKMTNITTTVTGIAGSAL